MPRTFLLMLAVLLMAFGVTMASDATTTSGTDVALNNTNPSGQAAAVNESTTSAPTTGISIISPSLLTGGISCLLDGSVCSPFNAACYYGQCACQVGMLWNSNRTTCEPFQCKCDQQCARLWPYSKCYFHPDTTKGQTVNSKDVETLCSCQIPLVKTAVCPFVAPEEGSQSVNLVVNPAVLEGIVFQTCLKFGFCILLFIAFMVALCACAAKCSEELQKNSPAPKVAQKQAV